MLTNQEIELLKVRLKKAIQKFNKKYKVNGWYIKSIFKTNIVIETLTEKEKKDLIKIKQELETMLKELGSRYQLVKKETITNCYGYWQTYYLEF